MLLCRRGQVLYKTRYDDVIQKSLMRFGGNYTGERGFDLGEDLAIRHRDGAGGGDDYACAGSGT